MRGLPGRTKTTDAKDTVVVTIPKGKGGTFPLTASNPGLRGCEGARDDLTSPVRLSSENVGGYLVGSGVFTEADGLEIEELTSGVSCMVFALRGEGKRVVVKQTL